MFRNAPQILPSSAQKSFKIAQAEPLHSNQKKLDGTKKGEHIPAAGLKHLKDVLSREVVFARALRRGLDHASGH